MKNPLEQFRFWKKQGPGVVSAPSNSVSSAKTAPLPSAVYPTHPTSILKDFIAAMSKKTNPVVLDIGPVIGSNIEFFLNLGIKIYVEDFLSAYMNPKYTLTTDGKATLDEGKFFLENFDYADGFFDGLLAWDLLSYLEPRFAKTFAERISAKMKPESLVLGFFPTHKSVEPASLHKYRILNDALLEYIPQEQKLEIKKAYQTRDVTQLFLEYETQRCYLLKHNLLEVMLKKRAPV